MLQPAMGHFSFVRLVMDCDQGATERVAQLGFDLFGLLVRFDEAQVVVKEDVQADNA